MTADADGRDDSRDRREPPERTEEPRRPGLATRLAGTVTRLGITIVGLAVFLFALGQAFGVDLLEMTADALTTETGQWLAIAFVALLLIGAAQRSIARY